MPDAATAAVARDERERMDAERRYRGTPVCGGIAIGPLHRLAAATAPRREPTGDPAAEAAALAAAIAAALAELEAQLETEDALAGDILEFQAALLDDPDLVDPATSAVASGAAADAAWRTVMDGEIATYRADGDDVLSARADDLADLRDRVLRHLSGAAASPAADVPEGAIVLADEVTPSTFLALDTDRIAGIAIAGGSPTSHVSILARARGVNLVVGLERLPEGGGAAILDAATGLLTAYPAAATLQAAEAQRSAGAAAREAAAALATQPAVTADGVAVKVMVNIDDPAILDRLDPATCDGIGLTRTEFLFQSGPPDEATQLAFYTRLIAWADGRPVTIRTLDAGGDKPIPGVTQDGEANPFLGVRGIRLSFGRPDLFRVQLRALARAAATVPAGAAPLKVMLPMVTVPDELERARQLLDEEVAGLQAAGIACAAPVLGMMVEVPAAALTAEAFDAAFYSVGSNDLIQYATASARDNPAVATLADPLNPAVLELIARTVAAGRARGVEVSLCGDMASSPSLAADLLATGLTAFSVAPAEVGAVKQAIRAATAAA